MRLLEHKVALVTGAGRGIGRAIADSYVEQGAKVALGDIRVDLAQAGAAELNAHAEGRAIGVALDVTDPASVQQAIETTANAFGQIDILVNNAGLLLAHPIVDFPIEDWHRVFQVNTEGAFLCSKGVARLMIERHTGGAIINISSAAANKADRQHAAYSASKAALIAFTRVLALELGEYGIRANALLPGATATEMLEDTCAAVPGLRDELTAKTVLGALATPRDQANAAVFLASDLSSHITGEYLVVAGGEFMNA